MTPVNSVRYPDFSKAERCDIDAGSPNGDLQPANFVVRDSDEQHRDHVAGAPSYGHRDREKRRYRACSLPVRLLPEVIGFIKTTDQNVKHHTMVLRDVGPRMGLIRPNSVVSKTGVRHFR